MIQTRRRPKTVRESDRVPRLRRFVSAVRFHGRYQVHACADATFAVDQVLKARLSTLSFGTQLQSQFLNGLTDTI